MNRLIVVIFWLRVGHVCMMLRAMDIKRNGYILRYLLQLELTRFSNELSVVYVKKKGWQEKCLYVSDL